MYVICSFSQLDAYGGGGIDYDRWQDKDFVLGIKVQLSNNYTCNGVPFTDICDDLQGVYPKDFKFTGWHPQCRWIATPILEDRQHYLERRLHGKGEAPEPVKELPEGFAKWMEENKDRLELAKQKGTLPYFVRDNALNPKMGLRGGKMGRRATGEARASLSGHHTMANFSSEQEENFREITKSTGYIRGKVMSFDEADNGRANITRDNENCATCVAIHEMRLRGYNITSLPLDRSPGSQQILLSEDTRSIWLTAKGKKPEYAALIGGDRETIISAVEKQTRPVGSRYHIGWSISDDLGHIVTAERTKEGLVL